MFYPPLRPYINNTVEEENMLRKNRGDLISNAQKKGQKIYENTISYIFRVHFGAFKISQRERSYPKCSKKVAKGLRNREFLVLFGVFSAV